MLSAGQTTARQGMQHSSPDPEQTADGQTEHISKLYCHVVRQGIGVIMGMGNTIIIPQAQYYSKFTGRQAASTALLLGSRK